MEIEHTSRGFQIINFKDRYDQPCTLQQSSLAECDMPGSSAIWFGSGENRMHLHKELLDNILPHLISWSSTGSFKLPENESDDVDAYLEKVRREG